MKSEADVHMKIYAEVPLFGKTWDILCGFEAWNGAKITEDSDEVSCARCLVALKGIKNGKEKRMHSVRL
jgi:hypothetical protein